MQNSSSIIPKSIKLRAVVVGIQKEDLVDQVEADLVELTALLQTLSIPTLESVVQKRARLSASLLLGRGKVSEIRELVVKYSAGLVVFDHPLSGLQVRNLESILKCQVLDRSGVILEIFSRTAKTKQAQTQVEIAKLEYLLPRLSGAWSHFGRQKGGGVRGRGMGEQQIEVDRRRARENIARLKKRLKQIEKERQTQRKSRQNELKVALVGYTNSGKTSLMSALTRAEVEGKDELFATLDASIRVIDPATRPKILLSDTVGFIRNLPHSLIESFKSTLEELSTANLLLHVVDVSHPERDKQMKITEEVLGEVGASDIPVIVVFNKRDLVVDHFLLRILRKNYKMSLAVCSSDFDDIRHLREFIFHFFETQFEEATLRIPVGDQMGLSQVHSSCVILESNYEREGVVVFRVRAAADTLAKFGDYQIDLSSEEGVSENDACKI